MLWDVCVVEKALGTGPKIAARDLLESITQTDKAAWVVVPVEGWANEFFQITRRKFLQYCIRIGTKRVRRCELALMVSAWVVSVCGCPSMVKTALCPASSEVESDR